jgi:hypothetical protein
MPIATMQKQEAGIISATISPNRYCNFRLGDNNYESIGWKETVIMNGVNISLYPAGHIIGSAQVR